MQKLLLPLFLIFTSGLSADPLIIQPGLPGTASKEINSNEAINIANTGFTKDDTVFMNHMIIHHEQALILSRLAPNRTNTKEILDLAGRIDVSQEDEEEDWILEALQLEEQHAKDASRLPPDDHNMPLEVALSFFYYGLTRIRMYD